MPGHATRLRDIFSLSAVILTVILTIGCSSGPLVTHSAISGEVRSISNWKIVWPDSSGWALATKMDAPADVKKKRIDANDYMNEYIEEIRSTLTQSYGLQSLDNQPLSGSLVLLITPSGFAEPSTRSDTTQNGYLQSELDVQKRTAHTNPSSAGVIYSAIGALSMLLENGRCISRVEVELISPQGKSLGWTVLRGRNAVKPKHVAHTLWNLLNTGLK